MHFSYRKSNSTFIHFPLAPQNGLCYTKNIFEKRLAPAALRLWSSNMSSRRRICVNGFSPLFWLRHCWGRLRADGAEGYNPQTVSRPAVQSAERQVRCADRRETVAVFDTSAGVFKAVLYPDLAPGPAITLSAW